jgi:hypothetical protein
MDRVRATQNLFMLECLPLLLSFSLGRRFATSLLATSRAPRRASERRISCWAKRPPTKAAYGFFLALDSAHGGALTAPTFMALSRVSRRLRKKVEMLFAHLKRILKLDRLRLRGPNGARDEFLLAATAQNLRKLADTGAELPAGLKTARSASYRVVSSAPRSTSIYCRSFSTESARFRHPASHKNYPAGGGTLRCADIQGTATPGALEARQKIRYASLARDHEAERFSKCVRNRPAACLFAPAHSLFDASIVFSCT